MTDVFSLQELKFLDNAMGSAHVLVYAFDVFIAIYEAEGYNRREAAESIIKNNLYGLEIDKRAYQLAYFAIMMKARQYNRRILNKHIELNLREFVELKEIPEEYWKSIQERGSHSENEFDKKVSHFKKLIYDFHHGKELGSVLNLEDISFEQLQELKQFINVFDEFTPMDILFAIPEIHSELNRILDIITMINQKYIAVVTNPPYLNKMSRILADYVNKNYKDVKTDLFSVFIKRNSNMLVQGGYAGFMTPFVWMFIKSYEKLRQYLIDHKSITSLIQMEYSAFEEATVPICAFTIKNSKTEKNGSYFRLSDFRGGMKVQDEKVLKAIENPSVDYFYHTNQDNFKKIPGMPISYWVSENLIQDFAVGTRMDEIVNPKQGLATAHNNRFLRLWWEVAIDDIKFDATSIEDSVTSGKKWFPYNKGGSFRRWYGNYDYVVNWENDGQEIRNFVDEKGKLRSRPQNTDFYFREAITWSKVSSGEISFRYKEPGNVFADAGMSIFMESEQILGFLGLLNSKVVSEILHMLSPTLNYEVGHISAIPVIDLQPCSELVRRNLELTKNDWDSFETSWNFNKHPLIYEKGLIKDFYILWQQVAERRFEELKKNEELINQHYINGYNLTSELDYHVEPNQVSIRIPEKNQAIITLISYAVGVIFGRYSLKVTGVSYAGGECKTTNHSSLIPAKDNILLINDDKYFENSPIDIVNRFVEFIGVALGEQYLEENLQFIADTLDGKGTSREIIREYFVKDFYKDHLQVYKKRPIYWQFESGKANGFKALIYLHRYSPETLSTMRIDYLHQLQKFYENTIEQLEHQIQQSLSSTDKNTYTKQLQKTRKQYEETIDYDAKIGHLANLQITLDLDDGILTNYDKLQTNESGNILNVLSKRT